MHRAVNDAGKARRAYRRYAFLCQQDRSQERARYQQYLPRHDGGAWIRCKNYLRKAQDMILIRLKSKDHPDQKETVAFRGKYRF